VDEPVTILKAEPMSRTKRSHDKLVSQNSGTASDFEGRAWPVSAMACRNRLAVPELLPRRIRLAELEKRGHLLVFAPLL